MSIAPVKLLLYGHSKAGKTALLASLAADYKLYIADFDNGLESPSVSSGHGIFDDEAILAKQYRENISAKTFYDKTLIVAGKMQPQGSAATDFIKAMGECWPGTKNGNIYSWGSKDIFVIDSLTFLGNACLNNIMFLNKRQGNKPQIQEYGAAMDMIESIIETLYNPAVQCNVIVTAHLVQMADSAAGGIVQKLFPLTLGNKLSPKIPRYFNNAVMIEKSVVGSKMTTKLHTVGTFNVDLGNTRPSKVPPIIEPANLATLFKLLRQEELAEEKKASQIVPIKPVV